MFDAEMTKRITRDPVVEYIIPKKIFFAPETPVSEDVPTEERTLTKFWDFS